MSLLDIHAESKVTFVYKSKRSPKPRTWMNWKNKQKNNLQLSTARLWLMCLNIIHYLIPATWAYYKQRHKDVKLTKAGLKKHKKLWQMYNIYILHPKEWSGEIAPWRRLRRESCTWDAVLKVLASDWRRLKAYAHVLIQWHMLRVTPEASSVQLGFFSHISTQEMAVFTGQIIHGYVATLQMMHKYIFLL